MKKVFFVVLLALFTVNVSAQLKKIEGKGIYTEKDIYLDSTGKRYSNQVSVHFYKQTLASGNYNLEDIKNAHLKKILTEIKNEFGDFTVLKGYVGKNWGDSTSVNIITKKNVLVMDISQIYRLEFLNIVCIDDVINKLKSTKFFRSIWGPSWKVDMFTPNDYSAINQWSLYNTEATKAWDITKGSTQVKLAGCESSKWDLNDPGPLHTELNSKITLNFGQYAGGHGQQVLGVAGALTNNNSGIASIGFNTSLMWFNKGYNDIRRARENNADIINMSWGSEYYDGDVDAQIHLALQEGRIVVAAAGNAKQFPYEPDRPFVMYPAAHNYGTDGQVIAVSATGKNISGIEQFADTPISIPTFNYSPGSNPIDSANAFIDFAAPGLGIRVLHDSLESEYTTANGTSLSSPLVAGVLALVKSIYPGLTPQTAYTILKNSVDKVDQSRHPDSFTDANGYGWNQYTGWGRVNAYKALKYTIEHYGGTFNQNVILPSGDIWNLQPGVTLTFASGCYLVVNGTLNAVGNTTNPITFTRSGTSGTWGGIQFNPYSSGTINNAIIRYATKGVDINQINTLTISNSEISNCSSSGIYIYGTTPMALSEPIITNCNIYDNTNAGGIVMYYSSPDITQCNIYNNYTGIGLADYSSPRFGYSGVLGKNNIHDNTNIGVYALRNSSPTEGGNNIIAANTFRNAQAVDNCYVVLENNWWGNNPPDASKIAALSGSTIDYIPYLTAPPSLSIYAANDYLSTLGIQKSVVASSNDSPVYENTVIINPIDSDPGEALSIYQLNTLWKQSKKSDINTFKTYLTELSTNKEKKLLYASAKLILSLYEKESRIKMVDEIISDYKDQSIIETAYMNKFLYYFNELKEYNQSSETMKELEAKFPRSTAVQEMKDHFLSLSSIDIQKEYNLSVQENKTTEVESESSLLENYPNPFNPSTQISFTLKERANISLKIYDVLGKEVANLADGYYEAGKHTATFDGSNLASGIYFYRLTTPSATITKKMMLVK